MKCINKLIALLVAVPLVLGMTACGDDIALNNAFNVYDTTDSYSENMDSGASLKLMASDLCVGGTSDTVSSAVATGKCGSAGVFAIANREVSYAKNIYVKRYPASLTKVLTAYVALKYGKLSDEVTVSEDAMATIDDTSSVCGLSVGDKLTLDQLLYGLLLESGNDAANVIAEHIAGDNAKFAELMNKEASLLGASHSHFMNPSGLPNDEHYTTAYDMYLIFNEAIKDENFVKYISSGSYEGQIKNAEGEDLDVFWQNTNCYVTGEYNLPENVTMIGGKTGTTMAAGNCLILYAKDKETGNPIISIVMKGEDKESLYGIMSQLLTSFSN